MKNKCDALLTAVCVCFLFIEFPFYYFFIYINGACMYKCIFYEYILLHHL